MSKKNENSEIRKLMMSKAARGGRMCALEKRIMFRWKEAGELVNELPALGLKVERYWCPNEKAKHAHIRVLRNR